MRPDYLSDDGVDYTPMAEVDVFELWKSEITSHKCPLLSNGSSMSRRAHESMMKFAGLDNKADLWTLCLLTILSDFSSLLA